MVPYDALFGGLGGGGLLLGLLLMAYKKGWFSSLELNPQVIMRLVSNEVRRWYASKRVDVW